MGVTTLQVNLNSQRMIDLHMIKKQRKSDVSDDMFARVLLLEKMDELLKE